MAQTVEEAQAALDEAQQKLAEAKKSGTVSDVVAATKAVSAANRALTTAKAGGKTAGQVRTETYMQAQAKAKEAAAAELPPLPEPDAYIYNYAWRTDVGGGGAGHYELVKTPNPYYDPGTNEIVDPATGQRKPMVPSMYNPKAGPSGVTTPKPKGVQNLPFDKDSGSQNLPFYGKSGDSQNLPYTPTDATPQQAQMIYTASDGKTFTDPNAYTSYQSNLDYQKGQRQSAYDLLYQEFSQYGLGSLVTPLKDLIQQGVSPSEFTLRLRDTDAYKQRFAANAQRIAKGLGALSEAQYIALEDQYQNIMRNYGLPESYYAKGDLGIQPGFQKFIANDVSAAELEDRIQTAKNRVINAAPEVTQALRQFYPNITNGDILAYALDPQQALTDIKRKVGAAEIGGAAIQAGLGTSQAQAEMLQKYGVTQAQAQQGYQTISGGLQRGSELASIYNQAPYTQTTAEQEVFGTPGSAQAQQQRKRLISTERAAFGGTTGAGGALARERAGAY